MLRLFQNILLLALALSCVAPVCHAQAAKAPTLEKDNFDDFIALRMKTERRRATFKDAVTPAFTTSAEGWEGRDYSFFPEESPEAALGIAYLQNLNYYPQLLFLAPPVEEDEIEEESPPQEEDQEEAMPQAPAPKKTKAHSPAPAPPAPNPAPEPPQQNELNKGQQKKQESHKWKPGDNLKKAGKKVSGVLKDTFDSKDGKKKK